MTSWPARRYSGLILCFNLKICLFSSWTALVSLFHLAFFFSQNGAVVSSLPFSPFPNGAVFSSPTLSSCYLDLRFPHVLLLFFIPYYTFLYSIVRPGSNMYHST